MGRHEAGGGVEKRHENSSLVGERFELFFISKVDQFSFISNIIMCHYAALKWRINNSFLCCGYLMGLC